MSSQLPGNPSTDESLVPTLPANVEDLMREVFRNRSLRQALYSINAPFHTSQRVSTPSSNDDSESSSTSILDSSSSASTFSLDTAPPPYNHAEDWVEGAVDTFVSLIEEELLRPHPVLNGLIPGYERHHSPQDTEELYAGNQPIPQSFFQDVTNWVTEDQLSWSMEYWLWTGVLWPFSKVGQTPILEGSTTLQTS
ncbi:hypothetical protein EDD85DRAFT_785237 [Armillaria nabsnona]|nr:hypothetical protein EDD85DRAFT_785237 [Armillaria nabsnona]